MKKRVVCEALAIVAAAGIFAQTATAEAGGLMGVLDPATGTFRVKPKAAPSGAPATTASFSGTVVVNYSATNVSKVATTTKLFCTISVTIYDDTGGFFETVSYGSPATVTASTVTCTVKAPYLISVSVAADVDVTFAISPPSVGATANTLVSQGLQIATFTIPPNGTTTTKNISTSI